MTWSVEVAAPKPVPGERVAAVDLGVRISASLSIEGVAQALHFEDREGLKDWDHLGREIAREQSCIAGTRGVVREDRAPSSLAIARLHQLRRLRLEHAIRTMANRIAETCRESGVSRVFLGHPKGILRDVSYGSSQWAGSIHNFCSFGRALSILECALESVGIAAQRVGERGSSSHCPACGSAEVTRSPKWRLRCKSCGTSLHSDQAGSRNIARQNKLSVCWDGLEASPRTVTLRWCRHRWGQRSANPRPLPLGHREFLLAA